MRIAFILIFMCLTACMATPQANDPATPTATLETPKQEANTEMRDAIQAPIEKAKQVEDQVLDGAEKQKADIEAAGG